jgi:hypothetical protein
MPFAERMLGAVVLASFLWGAAVAREPQVSGVPDTPRADAADAAVAADLETFLIDPSSSIRKMFRAPRAGSIKEIFSDRWTGDIVCYSINAKNRFGGYVGAQLYVFVVSGGIVIKRFAEEDEPYIVADECKLPMDEPPLAATSGARP